MIFFQSPVRRHIQESIGREIFEIPCRDRTYRGVTRTHSVGPFVFQWHQVLGVDDIDDIPLITQYIRNHFSRWNDIFFQIGATKPLLTFPLQDKKQYSADTVNEDRSHMIQKLSQQGRKQSRKENMPLATVITPLNEATELYDSYHKEHRRAIRKARKNNYKLVDAKNEDQWEAFYKVWTTVSESKGVGIMSWESFVQLMKYLHSTESGYLFLLMDGDIVTAGTVVASWDSSLYYLYGASNREYHNGGAHVMLQHLIMSRGYTHGYISFDHRGVASRALPHHPLVGVSRFKERFGGNQVEYIGNIDYVTNPLLYRLMRRKSTS